MGKSVNDIYKFLDNREQVVGTFARILTNAPIMVPVNQKISNMGLEKVYKYNKWINSSCDASIKEAEEVLRGLDTQFDVAVKNESDEWKREELTSKYKVKRALAADGVEKVKLNSQKTKENWKKFVSGEVLTQNDVYGVLNNYVGQLKNKQNQRQPVTIPNKYANQIENLINELTQTRESIVNIDNAIRTKKNQQFNSDFGKNGKFFIGFDNKNLKQQYFKAIEQCKGKYQIAIKEADKNQNRVDTEIMQDGKYIATKKAELDALGKDCANTDERYTKIINCINQAKDGIESKNAAKKAIIASKIQIENEYNKGIAEVEKNFKAAKKDALPSKKNKFMTFIGKIKAKFGKVKTECNEEKYIKNAIQTMNNADQAIRECTVQQAKSFGKLIGRGIIG